MKVLSYLVFVFVHPHVPPAAGRAHEEAGVAGGEQLGPDQVGVELFVGRL